MEQGRRVGRTRFEDLIVDLDDAMEAYDNVQRNVVAELVTIGIQPKKKPNMPEPELQRPVSEMTNEELGDFQGECAAWEAFLGSQLGIYKAKAMALKERSERLLSKLKNEAIGNGVAVTRAADMAKDDNRYGKARVEFIKAKGVSEAIEKRLEGLANQRKACSRYVEIRVREIDAHTRTESVNNRRRTRTTGGSKGAPTFRK
jgi:hypothetical protein